MDAPTQPLARRAAPAAFSALDRGGRSDLQENALGRWRDRVSACAGLGLESKLSRNSPPSAVQLVCIDAEGERADYENSQGNRVDKPKFGNARLAVWTIGDVRGDRVVVCEGAADALALAARETDPVIATLTTPRPPLAWRDALSVFDFVTLWPDMDAEDELGRRAGLDASVSLAQARKLAEQSVAVMGVDIGKDAADAAREAPLGSIDTEELHRFAKELEAEGMIMFEAFRYASTLLK